MVAVSAGTSEKEIQDGYGIVAEKDKPLPEPVKLLSAPDVSIEASAEQTSVQVSWIALDGAKSYRYQLAGDEKFNQLVVDSTTTENTIDLDQLTPGHYYLSVRGVDQFKLEGLDTVTSFEIKEPPPPVEDDSYWKIIMTIGLIALFL
jgi:predicted phage tail protein